MSAQVVPGRVVGVLRQCRKCFEWKLLEHYLILSGHGTTVAAETHVCAACRRRGAGR